MDKRYVRTSKFLSLVLRHKPQAIELVLDNEGWVAVDDLIRACHNAGREISLDELHYVVEYNDKKRFVIRNGRIRANQGHSIDISLGLEESIPPKRLYHGTSERAIERIREYGLMKMNRQHVHLSLDAKTAKIVGKRHGRPIVLRIAALAMHCDGHKFYLAENQVWLTDYVPWRYIQEDEQG